MAKKDFVEFYLPNNRKVMVNKKNVLSLEPAGLEHTIIHTNSRDYKVKGEFYSVRDKLK